MRNISVILLLIFSLCFSTNTNAQDVHFSHIHASPVYLNPSLTGLIQGDYRLIANYKNQWRSTATNFNTAQISFDGRVSQLKKNASFNLGLLILTDAAGDLNYRQTSIQVPMSVIMALDREGTNNIAVGMQHGLIHHSADLSKIEAFDQEPMVGSLFSTNKFVYDLSFGYTWYSIFKAKSSFYVGNSFYHVNTPKISTIPTNSDDNLFMKTNFMAGGELIYKNNKQAFLPSLLAMFQGPHRETTIGTFYRYRLGDANKQNKTDLLFGLWARFYASPKFNSGFDALISTIRFDYKKVKCALSYDFTMSKYAVANQARGGIELSLIYIGNAKPGKRPNRAISCPAW